jgi:hypothetical protein
MATRRVSSHDFADNGTWTSPDDSTFSVQAASIQHPVEGEINSRSAIYMIFVRFPKNACFGSGNSAHFKYYRSLDGVTPVDEDTPAMIDMEFSTLRDILVLSESEIEMTADVINGVYTTSMVQATYDLSTPGKEICLRQSLNERLDVYFDGHNEILDSNQQALTDPCQIVFIMNETIEF